MRATAVLSFSLRFVYQRWHFMHAPNIVISVPNFMCQKEWSLARKKVAKENCHYSLPACWCELCTNTHVKCTWCTHQSFISYGAFTVALPIVVRPFSTAICMLCIRDINSFCQWLVLRKRWFECEKAGESKNHWNIVEISRSQCIQMPLLKEHWTIIKRSVR